MEIEKEEIIEIQVDNITNFIEKEQSLWYFFGGILLVLLLIDTYVLRKQ